MKILKITRNGIPLAGQWRTDQRAQAEAAAGALNHIRHEKHEIIETDGKSGLEVLAEAARKDIEAIDAGTYDFGEPVPGSDYKKGRDQ